MMEQQSGYCSRNKGRVEHRMQEITRDMTTGALGALASHGVLIGEQTRLHLQRRIQEWIGDHVEIEAKVVELMTPPPAA